MIGWIIFLVVIFVLMFLVMSLVVKTFKLLIKAFLVALFFSLIIIGYSQMVPEKACAPCPKNVTNEGECVLSLCDCKCYPEGLQPEVVGGGEPKLCGVNCLGEFGVTGCEKVEGRCVEVKTSTP